MEFQKESVFVSAVRSFLKAVAVILGIFVALIPVLLLLSVFGAEIELPSNTKVTILPDANGKLELFPHNTPVVLEIKIHGVIGTRDLTAETIRNQLVDSRRGILQERVKAILLHINTPGGGVNDSDIIYRQIKAYKEKYNVPVFAYVEGLCASGGVYVSSAADKIFASPISVIGSVGVYIGPFFNLHQAINKLGIESRILSEGKDKTMMSPWLAWKEGEDESLKKIVASMYERFVNIVTEARPQLDREKLIQDYGAQVFDSVLAEKYGYIDEADQDYKSTMFALLEAARINPAKPYQVVQLQPKHNVLESLIKGTSFLLSGKIKHQLDLGSGDLSEINEQIAYLYIPERSGF